jgi:indole-3-glycerol phosphate synthase
MSVLERIVASTRDGVAERRAQRPLVQLERAAADRPDPRPFADALRKGRLSLVAEHKRRSPSAGPLGNGSALEEIVSAYERGGAAALSVLTEGPHFGGSLEDLAAARQATRLPLLRKDFIVDPYQVYESAVAGADALLLIVAALEDAALDELHGQARMLGLDVLVEVHDRSELERAAQLGAELIGINNRDLRTFAVDVGRTFELLPQVPPGAVVVSESGVGARAQLDELERAGVHAVLVGEALMRAPDPEAACRALLARA